MAKIIPQGWIEVEVEPNDKFMEKYIGTRCHSEFDPECYCCKSWKQYDDTGKVTVLVNNADLCDALMKGEV